MIYIYSRVSSDGQTTENQLHDLVKRYPLAEVVSETISGTKSDKPVLEALLDRLTSGDTLVIAALDRLGRSAWRALKLMEDLYKQGVIVVSAREGVDYSTSTGRMIATVIFGVAQMERDLISERTKASLQRLKSEGVKLGRHKGAAINNVKPLGRKPKRDAAAVKAVFKYRQRGMTYKEISELTKISTGRISKLLNAA